MAGRSSLSMVAAHRLFAPARPPAVAAADQAAVELDEADVIWGSANSSSPPDPFARAPSMAKPKPRAAARDAPGPASLPVNIPDWSKILGAEYGRSASGPAPWPLDARADEDGFDEDGGCAAHGRWVPPHELLLCRERAAASFSVREGAGRTLKGRDLRRVRNAIWEKTGFQD